eukprot:gene3300-6534_t
MVCRIVLFIFHFYLLRYASADNRFNKWSGINRNNGDFKDKGDNEPLTSSQILKYISSQSIEGKGLLTNPDQYQSRPAYQGEKDSELAVVIIQGLVRLCSTVAWIYFTHNMLKSMSSSIAAFVQQLNHHDSQSNIPSNISSLLPINYTLNSFELEILNSITLPKLIEADINDIAGLQKTKDEIWDCLYDPIPLPDIPKSSLLKPVQGILLYGPPGCGKTTLAQSISKATNIPMIHITPSLLLRKWVGETSQLTRAIFTLAEKIQPSIIFIDEMDSLFRSREQGDNAVDRNIKTECVYTAHCIL